MIKNTRLENYNTVQENGKGNNAITLWNAGRRSKREWATEHGCYTQVGSRNFIKEKATKRTVRQKATIERFAKGRKYEKRFWIEIENSAGKGQYQKYLI